LTGPETGRTAVIALGGNALAGADESPTAQNRDPILGLEGIDAVAD
jgi:carbamate kinase